MLKINLKPSEWLKIGVLILVFVVGSTAAYQILQPKPRLPIYNPSDLNPAVVDDDLERVGRGHRIGDFDLIDQWGNKADSSLLQGKIYVADFFSRPVQPSVSTWERTFSAYRNLQGRGPLPSCEPHGDARNRHG